jgi:hypothetical protein
LGELNQLELSFLFGMDFDLAVRPDEFCLAIAALRARAPQLSIGAHGPPDESEQGAAAAPPAGGGLSP